MVSGKNHRHLSLDIIVEMKGDFNLFTQYFNMRGR